MGNELSREQKREAEILKKPSKGEASPLYWACRNGDLDAVRTILASTNFVQLNQLEPNGSTALHAAVHYKRAEIVRILLREKGVMIHRQNRYDMTAYEEAETDEIRRLFDRPKGSQRFCSDAADTDKPMVEILEDVSPDDVDDDDDDAGEVENEWLIAAKSENQIRRTKAGANLAKHFRRSLIMRTLASVIIKLMNKGDDDELAANCAEILDEDVAVQKIESIIDDQVTPRHRDYNKACLLVSQYKSTGDIAHLLRLYTLDTPFYSVLNRVNETCFLTPVFYKLDRLQNRAFQGLTYRGLTMTREDLQPYQWLYKHNKGVLVFQKCCSSSINEDVAKKFTHATFNDKIRVIMVFSFPQKCDTAIQLFQVSSTIPPVSDYPQEGEVLILPCTLFRVTNIRYDRGNDFYRIYFENFASNAGLQRWNR